MFLYEVLPLGWFADIFVLLSEVPIFRFIIYYGVVGLVVAFFGGQFSLFRSEFLILSE